MTCKHFQQLIPLHVADDLSPDARRPVDAHLRQCDTCREFADDHRVSREMLLLLAADAPPPSEPLWPDVEQDLVGRRSLAAHSGRWLWALAAALVLAWTIGWTMFNPVTDPAPIATVPVSVQVPAQDFYLMNHSNLEVTEPLPDMPLLLVPTEDEFDEYSMPVVQQVSYREPF